MRPFEYPFEGCRWTSNTIIAWEHKNNWATVGEAHVDVSAETGLNVDRLIEPLTLLPFVYLLIHHKKLNYLCSLTCIVINVLITLLLSNLSPRNFGDICLNNAASPLEVEAELGIYLR